MKRDSLRVWITFFIAAGLGVLLHFLYGWFPNAFTALISPVRESLWEHLKILFLPLLLSALFLGQRRGLTPWLFSLLLVCSLMLAAGWMYNVVLQGPWDWVNILLYAVLISAGFLFPRLLWPLSDWPGIGAACAILSLILATLMILFTYSPPDHILFRDLSGGVQTWLTIPV